LIDFVKTKTACKYEYCFEGCVSFDEVSYTTLLERQVLLS